MGATIGDRSATHAARGAPLVRSVALFLGPAAALAPARPARGQTALLSYAVGSSIGVFANYPSAFARESCSRPAGGFSAWVNGPLTRRIVLEARATITAPIGGERCAVAGRPALDGEPYTRETLDEAMRGVSFFATQLAAVLDVAPRAALNPRLRIGGGRLWDKRIWSWLYGVEAAFAAGPGSLVAGVERWHLGFDVTKERWIRHELTDDELVSTEVAGRTSRTLLLKIGWEGPVW